MEKRVLVVDDEIAILDGVTAMLDYERIDSCGALDRASAMAMMERAYYPVILADLRLVTEEEGLLLIDAIRECSPRSRVAVMTGYATPQIEDDLLRRGVAMVLHKPVAGDTILAAVHALLEEIELAASGEEVNFEELYVTLRRKLQDIPRRRFGLSPDVAEDIVQEAWLLFFRKRGLIQAVRPWLSGTVANLSRQAIARRIRTRQVIDEDTTTEVPDDRGGDIAAVLLMRQGLDRVDEKARQLCSLIGLEGRSYEEVSRATGIPIGSIGPLYIRAKQKLRTAVSH